MENLKFRVVDISYSILFVVILIACMVSGMLAGAIYIAPQAQSALNCGNPSGLGKAIEIIGLFGGMFIGDFIGLFIMAIVVRCFVKPATYERWLAQFEAGKGNLPAMHKKLGEIIMQIIIPKKHAGRP